MASEQHIQIKKTFRYYTQGDLSSAHTLLYVLHGYGQLAKFFIEKFKHLDKGYYIVAPEGMHRFYLNGSSGRVGASWMTKEDRENDIEDTMNWLSELDIQMKATNPGIKRIVLGFSQGGAAAARWFFQQPNHLNHLIIWASVFPPDLPRETVIEQRLGQRNYFVIGTEDEYYTTEQQGELIDFYTAMGFETALYEGNHSIHHETLVKILRTFNEND